MRYKIIVVILIVLIVLTACTTNDGFDNIDKFNVVDDISPELIGEVYLGEIDEYVLIDNTLIVLNMEKEIYLVDVLTQDILITKSFEGIIPDHIDEMLVNNKYIVFSDNEYIQVYTIDDFSLVSNVKIGSNLLYDIGKMLLINNKIVYYNTSDRAIHCYDIEKSNEVWNFNLRNDISVTTDMLFYDNSLYVRQLGDNILKLSLDDGTLMATVKVTQKDDEKVRVSGESYYLTDITGDAKDLQLILNNWVSGVFKQCDDGTMYSIWEGALSYYDINRELIWIKELPITTPFVEEKNNYLFISNRNDKIIIIDLKEANIVMEHDFDSARYIPYILIDNRLLVNDKYGNLKFYNLDVFIR